MNSRSSSQTSDIPICDYEQSTYRTDFWAGQGREYEDGAERVALRRLLPVGGSRLLDIGAGFGRLARMYDGFDRVILLDYSQSQLEYARSQLGDDRFTYIAADIYRLPLATNSVDATVMVRVLHHLVDVPRAFAQVARALTLKGTFVLEFANKRHLKNLVRYGLGGGVNPFSLEPYEFADMHFDYHPRWLNARLAESGFEPERRLAVSTLRCGPIKRILPASFLVKIDAVLQRPTAGLGVSPSIFVRSQLARGVEGALAAEDDVLCCPDCGCAPLNRSGESVHCSDCGHEWPIVNGVYVFK